MRGEHTCRYDAHSWCSQRAANRGGASSGSIRVDVDLTTTEASRSGRPSRDGSLGPNANRTKHTALSWLRRDVKLLSRDLGDGLEVEDRSRSPPVTVTSLASSAGSPGVGTAHLRPRPPFTASSYRIRTPLRRWSRSHYRHRLKHTIARISWRLTRRLLFRSEKTALVIVATQKSHNSSYKASCDEYEQRNEQK